jgi:predicted permease
VAIVSSLLDALRQDLKQAVRTLLKSPGFAAIAIASLAIGIAGNAAIFSVADALFLRALPGISDPDHLVDVGGTRVGRALDTMSYPNFVDLRYRNTVFEDVAAYRPTPEAFGLTVDDSAQQAYGTAVSGSFFQVAGAPMAAGRAFVAAEDRIESPAAVMVVSYQLWERRFNRDRRAIGQLVRLNGRPFTVIGVAASGFTGTNLAVSDFWIPIPSYAALMSDIPSGILNSRAGVWLVANARLKTGITLAQSRDDLTRISRDLEREYPEDNTQRGIGVERSRPVPTAGRTPAALFIALLFGLVFLILVIACTNVGGMLLARGVARSREVALRLALGASRNRVVRLLVTESLLVSVIGGLVGIGLSLLLLQLLRGLIPALPLPVGIDLRIDWRVVAFSVALAVVTALLGGLLPAIETARVELLASLRVDPALRGPRRLRLRHTFLVTQMAMSVLLLVAALLLGRSLKQAGVIDPGFIVSGVEAIRVDLQHGGYSDSRGASFTVDLLRRIEQLPGVRSAATSRGIPLALAAVSHGPVRLPEQPFDVRTAIFPDWGSVSPGYFDTLQIPLLRGRGFQETDRPGAPDVVIINETLANRLFPAQDPIGKMLLHQSGPPPGRERLLQVVGVARDGKYRTLGEERRSFVYTPASQEYNSEFWILARTSGPSVLNAMQAAVRDADPGLPILQAGSLADLTAFALLPQRLAAWIAGSVGVIALLLATIGVYGLTAHAVAQRRREIGIRIALGALRGQVVRMTVRRSLLLTAIGSAIGVSMAAGLAQLLAGLLYGLSPVDPVSFIGAVVLLGAVALIASLIPARRAASINPVEALRSE